MANNVNFETALKRFSNAVANTQKYARICAEMAILHFEEHGDVSKAQQFLDAMPKNFVRRAAFLKWLAAHSPITMEEGKLAKDKSENAVPFATEQACAIPFWDYAPDPEQVSFGSDDVVVSLQRVLKKFENNDRYVPKDEQAMARLNQAKEAVARLAG